MSGVDDENNPDSIHYGPLSISNSKLYNEVTPWFLMSLGTLYISFLLFRYCLWRFRRRRVKGIRMERQKVEQIWKKHAARLKGWTVTSSTVQSPAQTACDDHTYMQQWYPSSESSATLVNMVSCSDDFVNEHGDTSNFSESVQELNGLIEQHSHEEPLPHYLKLHEGTHQEQQHVLPTPCTNPARRQKSRKGRLITAVISRMNGHYQQEKKRRLQWQWSVAMGYCRYDHGYHLNTIIQRILEERQQKTSTYLSNPTTTDVSSAEEQEKHKHEHGNKP